MARPASFTDDEVVHMLGLRALGMTRGQIAAVMTVRLGRRVSVHSVGGLLHRIDVDERRCGPAESPHDGTWPRSAWAPLRAAAMLEDA